MAKKKATTQRSSKSTKKTTTKKAAAKPAASPRDDKAAFRKARQALIQQRRAEAKKRGGGKLSEKRFRWTNVDAHALIRLVGIGGTPGLEVVDYYVTDINYYSKTLQMGCTSPATFGLRCPIEDWFKTNFKACSKEEKKELKKLCNRESIYLTFGFDMAQDPSPESIMPIEIKITMMDKINDQMAAAEGEDPAEVPDVFDMDEGCPIQVNKTGSGIDTEYGLSFRKFSPIVNDPDLLEEIREKLFTMSLWDYIYKFDWDKIEKLYLELTGEDMDPEYRDQEIPEFAVYRDKKHDDDDENEQEEADATEDDLPEGDEEEEVDVEEGQRVSVDYDGVAYEGVVTAVDGEDVSIDFDNGDQETVNVSEVTVLESEEDEDEEAEEEEVEDAESDEEEEEGDEEEIETPERVTFTNDEGEEAAGAVTAAIEEDGIVYYTITGDDEYEYERPRDDCEPEEEEEDEEEPEPTPPRRSSKKKTSKKSTAKKPAAKSTKKKAAAKSSTKTTKKKAAGTASARLRKLRGK